MQELKIIIRFSLVILLGWIFYIKYPFPQHAWIFASSIGFLLIRTGNTIFQQFLRLFVLGILSAEILHIAGCLSNNFILLAVFLFLITGACIWISAKFSEWRSAAYLINIMTLVASGLPVDALENRTRSCFIFLGAIVVIVANLICWPRTHRRCFRELCHEAVDNIKKLQQIFFEIYIKREYQNRAFYYEKRIYLQSRNILDLIIQLQEFVIPAKAGMTDSGKIVERITKLYESVVAQGHLRFRVKDFSTFEFMVKELQVFMQENASSQQIHHAINGLEDVYYNTLQVASAEPQAFLFFIQALKNSNSIIQHIELNYV